MTITQVRELLGLADSAAALDVLMPAEEFEWIMHVRGLDQVNRWLITGRGLVLQDGSYWFGIVRERVLRAIGIHELGGETRRRMRPDSPDLAADQLHPWGMGGGSAAVVCGKQAGGRSCHLTPGRR